MRQLISTFGDTLHSIALVGLVCRLTGCDLAALVAAEIAPVLLLGPTASVIIDRFSRNAVHIAAVLCQPGSRARSSGRREPGRSTS